MDGFIPKLTGSNTQAQLLDQGYTYNQAGFSYNQIGVDYGGVYNQDQDNIPMSMTIVSDWINTVQAKPVANNSGMLIGILGLTYP